MYTMENINKLEGIVRKCVVEEFRKVRVAHFTHIDADGAGCVAAAMYRFNNILAHLELLSPMVSDSYEERYKEVRLFLDYKVIKINYGPNGAGFSLQPETDQEFDVVIVSDISLSTEDDVNFVLDCAKMDKKIPGFYFEYWDHHTTTLDMMKKYPELEYTNGVVVEGSAAGLLMWYIFEHYSETYNFPVTMPYSKETINNVVLSSGYKSWAHFVHDETPQAGRAGVDSEWMWFMSICDVFYVPQPEDKVAFETYRKFFNEEKFLVGSVFTNWTDPKFISHVLSWTANVESNPDLNSFNLLLNYIGTQMHLHSKRWIRAKFLLETEDGGAEWTPELNCVVHDSADDRIGFSSASFGDDYELADICIAVLHKGESSDTRYGVYSKSSGPAICNKIAKALSGNKFGGGHPHASGCVLDYTKEGYQCSTSINELMNYRQTVKVTAGVDSLYGCRTMEELDKKED